MKFKIGKIYLFEQQKKGYLFFPTIFKSKLIRIEREEKYPRLFFEDHNFVRFDEIEKGHWKFKESKIYNEISLEVKDAKRRGSD